MFKKRILYIMLIVFGCCSNVWADDHFNGASWGPSPPAFTTKTIQDGASESSCYINYSYPHFNVPAIDEQIVSGKPASCQERLESLDQENNCYEVSMSSFKVYRASERLVSILYEGSEQGGCGPPYHIFHSLTFDWKTGRQLSLEDLFQKRPQAEDLGLNFYSSALPAANGFIFISSGGMVPSMEFIAFDKLAPYGVKKEYWQD